DELLGERQLRLELRRALLELRDAPVFRVEPRLATRLPTCERVGAVRRELLSPSGEMRAVDALSTEQRCDLTALFTQGRFANDAQLLGSGEPPPLAGLRHALDGGATRARGSTSRRWGG